MPTLNTKTFAQIVSDQVVAIQGAAAALVDFAIGSILRSIVESNASVVLWIQGLILQVLAATRAATCSGSDLDSWCADFGFYRLPAIAASGSVTFSRFSNGIAAFIPVGTQIQTSDTSPEIFTVTADTGNLNWNATKNGYDLPAGTTSITVPVQCNDAGTVGNVGVGQCNVLTQAIAGVDTVTNALAFTNGENAETDTAFRARFLTYIGSLSKATKTAIGSAITAVGLNVDYSITENYNYAGSAQDGHFYVVADDGTGSPSAGFLTGISNAIEAVRPFTVTFTVHAPVVTTANVAMTVAVASGYDAATVKAEADSAVTAYIDALKIDADLPYTKLSQLAYDASPGVTNVTAVTLNGGTSDLTADNKHIIRAGTVTVS